MIKLARRARENGRPRGALRCFSVTTGLNPYDVLSCQMRNANKPPVAVVISFFDLCHEPACRPICKVYTRRHAILPCTVAKENSRALQMPGSHPLGSQFDFDPKCTI